MWVQPGFSGGRRAYHIIIFADTGKHWICNMADCNVQETCSLTIFLSLRQIANAMNKKNSIATSRNSIFGHGRYKSREFIHE